VKTHLSAGRSETLLRQRLFDDRPHALVAFDGCPRNLCAVFFA
jgi:hypothetical protein